MKIIGTIYLIYKKIRMKILVTILKPLFREHGKNFWFDPDGLYTFKNISVGDNVRLGFGASFVAADTTITIGNKVLFGPNVKIRGGNHNTSQIGKYMFDVRDKAPQNDSPIYIEDDVWVGTGATILKGVRIGRGSIIGAGAIVTKDIPPYSVAVGVPAKVIKCRWSLEEILMHEKTLYPQDKRISREIGLHPPDWTKYVRVVGRNQIPLAREKGTCHETPQSICC